MLSFREHKTLNEGGNLQVGDVQAEKIDMTKSTRAEFRKLSLNLFKKLNKLYEDKFKEKLWINEKNLDTGTMFNGSTSFIFSPDYKDEDILKYKTKSGDIDIIIPKEKAENLWVLLKELEGKEIVPGVTYIGNNRANQKRLGDQINAIFKMEFKNGYKVMAQVDFEMLTVDKEGNPDEFSRFAHSSSFEDLTIGQKGVSHKYLLIALAGAISVHKDIVVVTPKSTKDKYTIKSKKGKPISEITTVKFSVDKGLRQGAFEKQPWTIDGKTVFKEVPASKSTYEQNLANIFEILFGKKPSSQDLKRMWSYNGLIQLMKKYLNKQQIEKTYERMLERVWGKGAQGFEKGNPELDYQIKDSMMRYFEASFNLKRPKKMVEEYYRNYR